MTEPIENGGTAYPAHTPDGYCTPGMSLLDHFAGRALTGLIIAQGSDRSSIATHADWAEAYADAAYVIAKAMIAAQETRS